MYFITPPPHLYYFILLPPGTQVQVEGRLLQDLKGLSQALQSSSGLRSPPAGCSCHCHLQRLLHDGQRIQTQAVDLLRVSVPQQSFNPLP